MSDFWNDLGNSVKKGFDRVADKTGELVNKSKDALDETKLKYEREQKYTELGKLLFEQMEKDLLNVSGLQEKCAEISQINDLIAEIEKA